MYGLKIGTSDKGTNFVRHIKKTNDIQKFNML